MDGSIKIIRDSINTIQGSMKVLKFTSAFNRKEGKEVHVVSKFRSLFYCVFILTFNEPQGLNPFKG